MDTSSPVESLYNRGKLSRAMLAHWIPPAHAALLKEELGARIARRGIVKWAGVSGSVGGERPRIVKALSVDDAKPHLIFDVRPIKQCI